jgi:hypothetical protein
MKPQGILATCSNKLQQNPKPTGKGEQASKLLCIKFLNPTSRGTIFKGRNTNVEQKFLLRKRRETIRKRIT